MRNKILAAIILVILHFLFCSISGAVGWNRQVILVPVISILTITIGQKKFGLTIGLSLLLTIPFFLVYTYSSIFIADTSIITYPIWIIGIVVSILTYIFLKNKVRPVFSISILSLIILIGGLIIWPNTFSYASAKKNHDQFTLKNSILVDSAENKISPDQFQGKVVLFDIWHSACLPCIKKFPEIQNLFEQFKSDPDVEIVSLNIPIQQDNGVRPVKWTKSYSFQKLFFLNETEYDKFFIDQVPIIVIMDKNQKCRYAGQLYTGWNIFIGNAIRIINRLKNE